MTSEKLDGRYISDGSYVMDLMAKTVSLAKKGTAGGEAELRPTASKLQHTG